MTRGRKLFAWLSLFGFALALRMGLALGSPNTFFPDEIFQTLEPAHRLAYGYGVISWEWRVAARSWVLPAFLAGVMRATAWLRSGSAGYLPGITLVLLLLSLTAVWFGYAWARRASGRPAAIVAALACAFYFGLVYFAPKAFYEVVAAHVLLPGLYLGVYAQRPGERTRLFLAGLLCALAACLRMQLLPAVVFALVYFCYPQWRRRAPAAAAGAAIPVLLFGLVDWITWSYPWQSFISYFQVNLMGEAGRKYALPEPWYWYALAVVVLLGPAVLFLIHGSRRSPFLAAFCIVVVVSHSVIANKQIRFIYPIFAPLVTLSAMGAVDFLSEMGRNVRLLAKPRWIVAVSTAFLLVSSAMLAAQCAKWYRTAWGVGAFDRLSREETLCGVGIYRRIWWESGGYAHLHRNVPLVQVENAAQLARDAGAFNALIAPENTPGLPTGFARSQCWQGVCLYGRAGGCAAPAAGEELNERLKNHDY